VTDVVTLLASVAADGTGPATDTGDVRGEYTLAVFTSGTVTAFSVQLQGSPDGQNWGDLGQPLTTAGAADLSSGPARWFRAVLSGYSGTGTVLAELGYSSRVRHTVPGGGPDEGVYPLLYEAAY
jgi:hypothetical protein